MILRDFFDVLLQQVLFGSVMFGLIYGAQLLLQKTSYVRSIAWPLNQLMATAARSANKNRIFGYSSPKCPPPHPVNEKLAILDHSSTTCGHL